MPNWQGEQIAMAGSPAPGPAGTSVQRGTAGARAVAVYSAPVTAGDEGAVAERLRKLAGADLPGQPAVLAYAVEPGTGWVAVAPDGGRSLEQLTEAGSLSPGDGAAVGWQTLQALEALHEASLAHGALGLDTVRVGSDGQVSLVGHWFTPSTRLTANAAADDLSAAGEVLCRALGVPARTGSPPAGAELVAPALARTLRAIANGASGGNVTGARMALGSTAAALVRPQAINDATHRLREKVRSGGAEAASRPATWRSPGPLPGAPAVPAAPAAPATRKASEAPTVPFTAPAPAPNVAYHRYVASAADLRSASAVPWPPRLPVEPRRLALPAAVLVGLLLVFLVGRAAIGAVGSRQSPTASTHRPPSAAATQPPTSVPATAPATPNPRATPAFGPAAAAPIKSVELRVNGGACSPGGSCSVEVQVNTTAAGSSQQVSWTIKAWDACSGAVTALADDGVTEQAGWTSVIGDRTVSAPAGKVVYLVAVVNAPAAAASPLLNLTSGASC